MKFKLTMKSSDDTKLSKTFTAVGTPTDQQAKLFLNNYKDLTTAASASATKITEVDFSLS